MQSRFTLSRHVAESDSHFDLFLEHAATEKLWTWQISETEPVEQVLMRKSGCFRVPALRIFDHRRIYLDFEGELSAQRGNVLKIDTGFWSLVTKSDEKLTIRLVSQLFLGKMELIFPQQSFSTAIPAPSDFFWELDYFHDAVHK